MMEKTLCWLGMMEKEDSVLVWDDGKNIMCWHGMMKKTVCWYGMMGKKNSVLVWYDKERQFFNFPDQLSLAWFRLSSQVPTPLGCASLGCGPAQLWLAT